MNLLAMEGMNDVTTVLFVFLIGVSVIFLGMLVIVLILQLMGKIFDKINNRQKPVVKTAVVVEENTNNDVVDEKIKAAIIGAIYMYYLNEGSDCEFVVRKIKRI